MREEWGGGTVAQRGFTIMVCLNGGYYLFTQLPRATSILFEVLSLIFLPPVDSLAGGKVAIQSFIILWCDSSREDGPWPPRQRWKLQQWHTEEERKWVIQLERRRDSSCKAQKWVPWWAHMYSAYYPNALFNLRDEAKDVRYIWY